VCDDDNDTFGTWKGGNPETDFSPMDEKRQVGRLQGPAPADLSVFVFCDMAFKTMLPWDQDSSPEGGGSAVVVMKSWLSPSPSPASTG
jgi:hypothetical protein